MEIQKIILAQVLILAEAHKEQYAKYFKKIK